MIAAHEVAEAALEEVGAGCAAYTRSHAVNLRWANSALTTNGDAVTTSLTVVALDDAETPTRCGTVSGQAATAGEARALAAAARSRMQDARPTPEASPLPAGPVSTDWEQAPEDAGIQRLADVAGTLAEVDIPGRLFGYAERVSTTTHLATSAGIRYRTGEATERFELCGKDEDWSRSAWWGQSNLDVDAGHLSQHLGSRLAAQSRRGELAAGRHRVILTPSALADLMIYLTWSAAARDAVEGHSVFSRPGGTALGEQLTPRQIDLFADPAWPAMPVPGRLVTGESTSTVSVFDNGLALRRTDMLRAGQLSSLLASRATAARYGLEPAVLADNLVMLDADGSGDLADLVGRTEDAVLITCLWYIREVDPQTLLLTGLTRDGVYRVRQGRITEALPNFRFNVSPVQLLAAISDASAAESCLPREWADWAPRSQVPAAVVEGFNLSSPSDAL